VTAARATMLALLLGAALVVAAATRVVVSGRHALALGYTAMAMGDRDAGVESLGRAARWYLPGLGIHREAREALMAVGADREAAGDAPGALSAYRQVRGAILGSRWLITPDRDLLEAANERIAVLMASRDAVLRGDQALGVDGHRALLARDATPSPVRSAAAVGLFVGWIVVTMTGLWRSVRPDGRVVARTAAPWAAASLVLLVSWIWMLAGL